MNFRTMALTAVALIAWSTSGVSFAQTAPGPQGTPPPPPVPLASSSPLISTSPEPGAAPFPEVPAPLPSTTPTPPPAVVPSAGPAEPSASASPGGRGRHARRGGEAAASPSPNPSDTPEPPQFSTLDGVWEVALQPLNGGRTVYSHLYITQQGNTLSGTWRRTGDKGGSPFTGTFDGRLFKLTFASGTTTLSGYEENYMDMVGLFTDGEPSHQGTPFTAAHRKRIKDREVNIGPGL